MLSWAMRNTTKSVIPTSSEKPSQLLVKLQKWRFPKAYFAMACVALGTKARKVNLTITSNQCRDQFACDGNETANRVFRMSSHRQWSKFRHRTYNILSKEEVFVEWKV